MKKSILILALGLLLTQLVTACNHSDETSTPTTTTNSMATNMPATTN